MCDTRQFSRALICFEFMFILFDFPPDAVSPKLLASDFKFVLKSISGYLWDESIYACYQTILLNINYLIILLWFHTEILDWIKNFYEPFLSLFHSISDFKIIKSHNKNSSNYSDEKAISNSDSQTEPKEIRMRSLSYCTFTSLRRKIALDANGENTN